MLFCWWVGGCVEVGVAGAHGRCRGLRCFVGGVEDGCGISFCWECFGWGFAGGSGRRWVDGIGVGDGARGVVGLGTED